MIVQTQITEYDNDNNAYLIEITAEYVDFERGERDSFGVPLEPDFDAHFIIEDIYHVLHVFVINCIERGLNCRQRISLKTFFSFMSNGKM